MICDIKRYHLVGGEIPLGVVHILAGFHLLRGVDAANRFISVLPASSFILIFSSEHNI